MAQLAFVALALAMAAGAASAPMMARAKLGALIGTSCGPNNATAAYLGIPYGQAARWAAPKPYIKKYPKAGLDATHAGPWCPQPASALALSGSAAFNTSEDCLYLNVFTPASATPSSKLPVRFFIHGGSYNSGSGAAPLYNGCQVSSDADVVTVTINYRLGVLGFLALPGLRDNATVNPKDRGTAGNWGLLDQRLALHWVRTNIAAFGGDPSRVLIHGESAGANSVGAHLVMPQSDGLFAAALIESGAVDVELMPWLDAIDFGAQVAAALDCNASNTNNSQQLACMRAANTFAVLAAQSAVAGERTVFVPVIDGVEFPKAPLQLLMDGAVGRVPVLMGTNNNEGALFVLAGTQSITITQAQASAFLATRPPIPAPFQARVTAQYTDVNYGTWFRAASALVSHQAYMCGTRRAINYISNATAARGNSSAVPQPPVRAYNFTQPASSGCYAETYLGISSLVYPLIATSFNSTHSTELPFVFLRPLDNQTSGCTYTAAEKALAPLVSGMWTAFAATGSPLPPRSQSLDPKQQQLPAEWPVYNSSAMQALGLGAFPAAETWDLSSECQVWDDIAQYQAATGRLGF